ncbi:Maf family protein [Mycolicibacterium confluentis]|uniref:Nucleoside triphosphate pyrophosphatase n=1 Tax=Mycolicibacterium confluentis TaxID=28047 RepID=A0A7I7Y006_9MYCO|nr:nucleoside triphosphate pyrophosphatase [Mycolicibacterium confluentis]MCV7319886.1 septum formation inhibitor Maf [Mycolicibacterium confluentis]ORV34452.1 septum formation inhibitor Maf [Mycolicibacterium confluentis]BBZ34916.1 Maf-like protein [Mycolicibacterium confluentis]
MTRVVLGSASSGRLSVLRNAGVDPLVIVSGVDEDAVIAALPDATPAAVVGALADAKADEVVTRLPEEVAADCVVIGCDSMLLLDGRLCGKPGTAEAAQSQWRAMAGRSGELLTGHCLIRIVDGRVHSRYIETGSTTVHFGTPSEADLDAYIDHGEPLGVAGGFTLDGLGGWFVDRIDGDPANVIGLSLPLLRRLLHQTGLSPSALWRVGG